MMASSYMSLILHIWKRSRATNGSNIVALRTRKSGLKNKEECRYAGGIPDACQCPVLDSFLSSLDIGKDV